MFPDVFTKLFILDMEHCLKFSYYMYGDNTGTLNVLVDDGQGEITEWSRTGDQGQQWNQAEINLNFTTPSRVSIKL